MSIAYYKQVFKEDRVGKAITDLPSHTTVHTAPYTAVRHIQTSHAHALLSE
jgi:hypothetical protein